MKYTRTFIALTLMICVSLSDPAHGQTVNNYIYNYNIYNGLPSNRIYDIITDKHGYLWIATEKGVVKYNGYEFKVFGTSDGLPTDDVWQLVEDRKGKIWLGNISDQIGYLLNDHYHKAFIKDYSGTVFPQEIRLYNDGIIFKSSHGSDHFSAICIASNDTIVYHPLDANALDLLMNKERPEIRTNVSVKRAWISNTESGSSFVLYKSVLFKRNLFKLKDSIQLITNIDTGYFNKHIYPNRGELTIGEYIAFYNTNKSDSKLYFINTLDGMASELDISKYCAEASIYFVSPMKNKKQFYVVTRTNIIIFDYSNGISYFKSYRLDNLVNNKNLDGDKVFALNDFSLWKDITGTTTDGYYVSYGMVNKFTGFKKADLHNFELSGNFPGYGSFWWNGTLKTLIQVNSEGKADEIKIKSVPKIYSISRYSKDTFFINSYKGYLFIPKKKLIEEIGDKFFGGPVHKILMLNKNSSLAIHPDGIHLHKSFNLNNIKGGGYDSACVLSYDKYTELLFDSLRNSAVTYNYNKIFFYTQPDISTIIKCNQLNSGVNKIEQLTIDNHYGNYFLKGLNNISVYDFKSNKHIKLLNNLNTRDSKLCVTGNKLIVAGRFGIALFNINGLLDISKPLIYHNFKNTNYKYIYYCVALNGKVLINTDKGAYEVPIPTDNEIANAPADSTLYSARFIYKYRDSVQNFKSGDTIAMIQTERKLQFDIINPYGDGHLYYSYRFQTDTEWHLLNADEINLPLNLEPDNYYTLLLKVNDDVWQSEPVSLNIYINPYWSQTKDGRSIIWTCIIAAIILLIAIIVFVTRRIVINMAKRRTFRMELELKAIYAQINPHFIFNTLNSALLLVSKNRMDEAYVHISKFSRLLRGYLKSSRNKLITLTEEIVNLRDYIELQQTRFKNKFEYQMIYESNNDLENYKIPSLLLQPFVENAINHGILPMETEGILKIIFELDDDKKTLTCIIEDNGIGRKKSKENNEKNKLKNDSFGDLLIKDLVSIFNRFEDLNIEIKYTDKELPDKGTRVTIKIKKLNNAQ